MRSALHCVCSIITASGRRNDDIELPTGISQDQIVVSVIVCCHEKKPAHITTTPIKDANETNF